MSESSVREKDVYVGTGSALTKEYVTIDYPFEKYQITVKLTLDGHFVGIEEVRVNKDFRSYKQSISQEIFREIDDYKPE